MNDNSTHQSASNEHPTKAPVFVISDDAKQGSVPDQVTIASGDKKVTVNVDNLQPDAKSVLAYVFVFFFWALSMIVTQFHLSLPFTSQQFTDIATLVVSFLVSMYTTWKDNPLTKKSLLAHKLSVVINVVKQDVQQFVHANPSHNDSGAAK